MQPKLETWLQQRQLETSNCSAKLVFERPLELKQQLAPGLASEQLVVAKRVELSTEPEQD